MIKNQLYPYIEKYFNEYLYGFSKEQLEVGVMNGIILLEKLNIRPDKANEKLDTLDSPIWLKAGLIKKIQVGCSLMNFIGETPLEVEITDVDLLLCPSFKWIIRNQFSFLEETEDQILEEYDAKDNNSKDIFSKKVHIFDGSILKKKPKLAEFLKDSSKISGIIHKIFTKILKFYYQTNYFVNIKVKNVHIRYEDDTFNFYGGTILGIKIANLEMSLSAEGKLKKDSFKINDFEIYSEEVKTEKNFFVSSNQFLSNLNDGIIDDNYFKIILDVFDTNNLIKRHNESSRLNILEKFNFMGKFSIVQVGKNIDLFSVSKNFNFQAVIFCDTLKLNINPNVIGKLHSFQEFLKGYYLNDPIQDFKPMRKPYNVNSEVVSKFLTNKNVNHKRKSVSRDWFYYLVWFFRFRNSVYYNKHKNKLEEEFSKYYSICCTNQDEFIPKEYNIKDNEFKDIKNYGDKLNDSISLRKNKDGATNDIKTEINDENLNPENINIGFTFDLNLKSVSVKLFENLPIQENNKFKKIKSINILMSNVEAKIISDCKKMIESSVNITNILINNIINNEIQKIVVSKQQEAIISSNFSNTKNEYNGKNILF